ncbi:hypothetical protein AB1Y20_021969 [Prymnesium parvum]|uniref:Nuclear control of ATPase protein 2 n=1 Tax=Prymnesium parvum TaxID=97485 RepID=A0AB34JH18_PRYPA
MVVSRLLLQHVPPPPHASSPCRELYDAICELLDHEHARDEPDSLQDVELMLSRWLRLEVEADVHPPHASTSGAARSDDGSYGASLHRALTLVSIASPLRSFGASATRSPRSRRAMSMPSIPLCPSTPELNAEREAASHELPTLREHAPASLRPQDAACAPGDGWEGWSAEDSEKLEDARWVLLAKACASLLYWRTMSLIELALRIERSHGWWARQHARPLRYLIWCGPRRWLRAPLLGGSRDVFCSSAYERQPVLVRSLMIAAGMGQARLWREWPAVAMAELNEQLLRIARQVGKFRHQLSALHRAPSARALRGVVSEAVRALGQVQEEERSLESLYCGARAPPPSEEAVLTGVVEMGGEAPREPKHVRLAAPTEAEARRSFEAEQGLAPAADAAADALAVGRELLLHVGDAPPALRTAASRLAPFALPSHLSRHWLSYAVAGGVGTYLVAALLRTNSALGSFLRASTRAIVESTLSFWREHLYTPALVMVRELVHRQYLHVSNPRDIEEAEVLLEQLLRQFRSQWGAQLEAANNPHAASGFGVGVLFHNFIGGAAPAAEHAEQAANTAITTPALYHHLPTHLPHATRLTTRRMHTATPPNYRLRYRHTAPCPSIPMQNASGATTDAAAVEMEAMNRLFERQMQSPAYNMIQGPLLQLLLIQTQYMKRELLRQMAAMDALLRENYFTAAMSALLPGALALALVVSLLRRSVRKLRSKRRSRRSLVKEVRGALRDAERLLMNSLATSDAPCMLAEVDSGLLVISLHSLRQIIERHRVLLSPGERRSFIEDLDDLESEVYDCGQKILVLQRIYRTQLTLLST